ncbi:MAG: post-COAP-1 domain-containing protein [Gaiellaceae bacterium]
MRVPHRLLLVGLIAALAVAVAAAAVGAAQAAPPTLSGETFVADVPTTETLRCDPSGTSTVTYSGSGVAAGPFPGTFTESGTAIIGQQVETPIGGPSLGLPPGRISSLHAQFTIDSPLGQVIGQKFVETIVPGNFGVCLDTGVPTPVPLLNAVCQPLRYESLLAQLQYSASITVASTTSADSGLATLAQNDLFCTTASAPGGTITGSQLDESFASTQPVDTPGHATGGGQVPGATFGFTADSTGDSFKGNCRVVEHDTGSTAKCLDVTHFTQTGNHVVFSGDAQVDGVATQYRIDTTDNAEPGRGSDTFAITTDSGFAAGGVLTGGDVQVHK